jgi:hypothetical protein
MNSSQFSIIIVCLDTASDHFHIDSAVDDFIEYQGIFLFMASYNASIAEQSDFFV